MLATSASTRHRSSRFERLVAGLNAANRLRRYMAKHGATLAGRKLWTSSEITLLRHFYPDFRRLCAVLPHRSLAAIRAKASRLSITRPLKIWSEHDLKRLKTPYCRGVPMPELMTAFPGKTAKQIWARAAHSGWRRPRKPPKLRNMKAYDTVRVQAFALKLTMRDLAILSRTKSYFLQRPYRVNWSKINKAATLLEGDLSIVWGRHGATSA
jgi:hypothetical protein